MIEEVKSHDIFMQLLNHCDALLLFHLILKNVTKIGDLFDSLQHTIRLRNIDFKDRKF
jgi:hypothetical protein